jgi:tRNA (guanine-N7-)-methyltransferase
VAKRKLQRFAENETFPNVVQPRLPYPPLSFPLKGRWSSDFFRNDHPIVLELGCGRGEYTVALAKKYPERNFIGVDVKGARLWRGAKTAVEESMNNVGFLRIMIDQIFYYFGENEVSEIWITFPDPQPQVSREKKRLTSPTFLGKYRQFLKPGSIVHLKTDSDSLFEYTEQVIKEEGHTANICTWDLYGSGMADDILDVKTTYEKIFLAEGKKIKYLNFTLRQETSL